MIYIFCLVKLIVSLLVFSLITLTSEGNCLFSEYIAIISPFIIQFVWEFLFISIATKVFNVKNMTLLLILTNILSVDLVAYFLFMILFRATMYMGVLAIIKMIAIYLWLMIKIQSDN